MTQKEKIVVKVDEVQILLILQKMNRRIAYQGKR